MPTSSRDATPPTVHPGRLAGTIRVPGDKSIGHRALLAGAIADGPVDVRGIPASGDVLATARALRALGLTVELEAADDGLAGRVAGEVSEAGDVLDCGNSGTSLRLLCGLVAGLDGVTVLTGDASLRQRPIDRVATPLRRMGATVIARGGDRWPPVTVRGGPLEAIDYDSPVASAQVKSAILLAGLAATGPTTVRSPRPSRDHTERLLVHLGVSVRTEHANGAEVVVLEPRRPRAAPLAVPGDVSSATFWFVAAAIARTTVTVEHVGVNPRRTGGLRVLADLGAQVTVDTAQQIAGEAVADVTVTGAELGHAEVSGARVVDAIDELPVLALAGALSDGGLDVYDAAELRVKESDRIATLGRAFADLGLRVQTRPDGFHVPGGQRPEGGTVDAGGDHRIAMTAAIAATVATGAVTIRGAGAVTSSYPTFLDDLTWLGGQVDGGLDA